MNVGELRHALFEYPDDTKVLVQTVSDFVCPSISAVSHVSIESLMGGKPLMKYVLIELED